MRSPFAPIEAGPAEDADRALAATGREGIDVNPDPAEKLDAGVGHQTGIVRQLRVTARPQRVRKGNAEPAGTIVVTRTRCPHGCFPRTAGARSPPRDGQRAVEGKGG